MTEDYKPTDNAIAERINGILKTERIYPQKKLPSFEEAQLVISRYLQFYNYQRPYMSIGYETPSEAHSKLSRLREKCGKTKYTSKSAQIKKIFV